LCPKTDFEMEKQGDKQETQWPREKGLWVMGGGHKKIDTGGMPLSTSQTKFNLKKTGTKGVEGGW